MLDHFLLVWWCCWWWVFVRKVSVAQSFINLTFKATTLTICSLLLRQNQDLQTAFLGYSLLSNALIHFVNKCITISNAKWSKNIICILQVYPAAVTREKICWRAEGFTVFMTLWKSCWWIFKVFQVFKATTIGNFLSMKQFCITS